ncbi:thiamine phosphate synthase [Malaciobacter halophilus]|uniref:Thiamine phosphate synthase n=1 Tax=Malaciobacter halophilus TaxID=197482 RepID=A0A2N1IZS6_9BACT|nr:thiamine phosphate synthase [Malaciobacter halophilus]AXH08926.1 thiamine phosphate synthase (TMP-TENI domain) [Malaciobacter halophilus]PKI79754.1 thiamine phosphate synthase [Malaciobacter halophilus]
MNPTKLEELLNISLKASFNNIYALCDYETLNKKDISLEQFVKICKNKSVKLIQYRDKINSDNIQIQNIKYLKSKLEMPIIINDKLNLIEYADGLHLGQEDFHKVHKNKKIAIKLIRSKIKDKLLGLSTHNEVEILQANELELDMIGLGAYKATNTKDVSTVLGDKISYLAKMSIHPVCAIGSVKCDDNIENIHFNVVGSGLYED